jgi:hypothetical protein
MHIADEDLFDAVLSLRKLLRTYGRLLVSLPSARDDVLDGHRDAHGRLFVPYWPIFASSLFIPQMQSESTTGRKVAFRRQVMDLMEPYRLAGPHGGLSAWEFDRQAGRLSATAIRLHERALQAIGIAIRNGPVAYSGGSLDSGPVFGHDSVAGEVLMSAELWQELSLLGHWISDAVIVRWASLTERFGYRQGLDAGTVLPLLLAKADPGRSTLVARKIFLRNKLSGAPGQTGT